MFPLADFPEALEADPTSALGIVKWDPPIPGGSDAVGPFPSHLAGRTDSERAQNLIDVWPEIVTAGCWIPTEKVDGTSLTVGREPDGTIRVASRNFEVGPASLHHRGADRTGLLAAVRDHESPITVQAELAGALIQGNPLGLNQLTAVVFAVWSGRTVLARGEWPAWVSDGSLPAVVPAPEYDLLLPTTVEETVTLVDGIGSLLSPGRKAEGVVWHLASGLPVDVLGGRSTFKTISNRYLLKHGG